MAKPKQAGKKERGLEEGIFVHLLSAEGGIGWEAGRLCDSRKTKPAKIVSLIEKIFATAL